MLKGKTVVLGVSGSIAAYKAANLASLLKKQHADVHVIMTENALQFITPVTFETLTGNKCLTDTFDRNFQFHVEHVELAKRADLLVVAPASANVMARLAHGMADDMLTTTALACRCPKLIAPAMNTRMYENPVTQDNMELLKKYGWQVIEPEVGHLACGDTGKGKFPEERLIVEHILNEIAHKKDMEGMHVLVTAGPTMEAIDPVRFISNHSTGKMGYAIARICRQRGAEVTLVTGRTNLPRPAGIDIVDIKSAQDMFEAVTSRSKEQDLIIKAAAVADYRPAVVAEEKVKKADGDMSIALERTQDILAYLGEHKQPGQVLCGFAMETENMVEHALGKLKKKNLDLIVANNVKVEGAGFGTDTNVVTLITDEEIRELALMKKEEVAQQLVDELLKLRARKRCTE
ncbi:MAG: bifunctional phosphopantothenoylcysteine decarboxylase/phosphopantothenate--cysteine ligase CoaBC [Lachnospiraceae bacterium]|nr:bifunctional phosphopantothenoylcysteine decarboxylase/phosphopantothenate--cysteine ligase CoaBC [Lachnospiraceae bacterium]MDD7078799.1 bifunctional phosphopantothenoylcysteine decarboxylase/phosphopantothenate--cysteine ligase CoaBC [Lachnospiraceae bacterium]MDY3728987.1 bifunctional phosphopantothenoylcysteine decarboxylase/phosphopantothenate--cysteine ligase CoaBC [Candidatus Choladocola sp.]